MKILDFVKDKQGSFSSPRIFGFILVAATLADWMSAVFTVGIWHPNWETIGMVLGVLGYKAASKLQEEK